MIEGRTNGGERQNALAKLIKRLVYKSKRRREGGERGRGGGE
jgi:hypothetical protein